MSIDTREEIQPGATHVSAGDHSYRVAIALVLRNVTRDVHSGKRITGNMIQEERIDDHHVFPPGYIAEHLPAVGATLRDCILNRTLRQDYQHAHIRISKRAPSDYLKEIKEALDNNVDTLIASHLLPGSAQSPLLQDQFEAFLDARETLLGQQIKAVTS